MAGDYGSGGDLAPDNKEPGGYCIEIYVDGAGQVQGVKVEQKSMEGGAEVEMEAKLPANSIEEALSVAKGIYDNNGKPMAGDMTAMASEQRDDDAVMRGYGKGSFANQRSGLPLRKVFSDTM